MARMKADNAARTGDWLALKERVVATVRVAGFLAQERGKIVVENVSAGVVRVGLATCPCVPWAKVTFWIVGRALVSNRFLLTLPGAFGAVRRYEDPLPPQGIVAAMGMFGGVEFHER
jgi:hypothetical protein